MIKYIVMLILVSSIVNATTETIDLGIGDNFIILDKNITLTAINDDEDKIIVCVNNQKAIIEDNEEKLVNGVYIDVKRVDSGNSRLQIKRDCKNCECDENCDNDLCIQPSKEDEVFTDTEDINEDVNIETNEVQNDEIILISGSKDQQRNNLFLGIGIVLIIIIILIFIMLKIKK